MDPNPVHSLARQHRSDWTLITVTYNSSAALRRYWADRPRPSNVRWIVVDNDSGDDSVGVAFDLGAEVVPLRRNVGFARANNVALARASSDYVGFVNPDVAVVFDDLDKLAAGIESCRGFVAPQLLNRDTSVQANGRGLPFVTQKFGNRGVDLTHGHLDEYRRQTWLESGPTPVAWVMGAVLAGRAEDFRAIGGWDERFFIYYEDHEIGLRAWEHGLTVFVDPRVRWMHGWERATTHFALRPWMHELASASRFYGRRPDLLSRSIRRVPPRRAVEVPAVGTFVRRRGVSARSV